VVSGAAPGSGATLNRTITFSVAPLPGTFTDTTGVRPRTAVPGGGRPRPVLPRRPVMPFIGFAGSAIAIEDQGWAVWHFLITPFD